MDTCNEIVLKTCQLFGESRPCRFLRVVLDQRELTRIGAPNFRPDMQVGKLGFEHVYHLNVERHRLPVVVAEEDEYLSVPASASDRGMELLLRSVGLVKVERGAEFGKMITFSNATSLYIDLNGATGTEDVNVIGFIPNKVYFVTQTKEIPLKAVSLNLLM
jgi:hypothetical protein